MSDNWTAGTALGCFVFWIAMVAAWVTHIWYCISNAMWVALIAGALVAPVGVVHGVMIWFGAGLPAGALP